MNDPHETQTPIKTLSEFMEWVHQLESGEYLFRGLPCARYDIIASAYLRLDPEAGPAQLLELNKELIKDARLQGHDYRNGRELSDLEVLAELQHFRAATCLIDFTSSAAVALWFACQPTFKDDPNGKVSAIHNEPTKITEITPDLLTKDTEIDHFFQADENRRYPLYRWQPSQLNNRIVSQHSVFLFGHDKIIEPDAKCVIAADSKQKILESLESFSHISDITLFPDFDGFVRRRSYNIPYLQLTPNEYWKRGNRAAQRGEYRAAINDYTQAIKVKDDEDDKDKVYNSRDNAHRAISAFQAAIEDYTRVIELNPDDARAYNNRGGIYRAMGNFQEAIKDYDEAIRHNPDETYAYNNKGTAHHAVSAFQAAIEDYTRVIELNPNDIEGYNNRGDVHNENGAFQAAIEDYTQAITLNPDDARAYNNRGVVYGAMG